MSKIEILWSEDSFDCESCGWSFANGAVVKIAGEVVIDKPAVAACYGGQDTCREDIFKEILDRLGHPVEESFLYDD